MFRLLITLLATWLSAMPGQAVAASEQATSAVAPLYKPSSRSPEPMDIRTNRYGASADAPEALEIDDRVPDFEVPQAGGGTVSLASLRADGAVVIIFYRGHW